MTSSFSSVSPARATRHARSLALLLAFAPMLGCGLINLNGKPLGGGGSTNNSGNGGNGGDASGEQASNNGGDGSEAAQPGKPTNTRRIDDIEAVNNRAPLTAWTAAQQWQPRDSWGQDFGYGSLSGGVALADELGDRLSQLGRASLIEKCFHNAKEDASSMIAWAVCGSDVRALDLKKLEAELDAAGIGPASHDEVVARVKEQLEAATKIGAAVEAAAKDDPGVAAVLAQATDAREEWATYASKHADRVARFLALKDAARSGKSNDKGFDGCYAQTQPAFAKLVRATKFPWDIHGDPMPFHVGFLTQTIDGYVTTVAFGACAFGQAPSGEALYAAAANQEGGRARFGARSVTLAKILAPSFKPKFADRGLSLETLMFHWKYGMRMANVNWVAAIMTPGGGVVGALEADGESTKITFKGDTVEACLEWQDTNRVAQYSPNGSVSYQKVCKRRGQIANQASAVTVPTKALGGIAPGVQIITVDQYPVVAWKGKKITGVLGVALN